MPAGRRSRSHSSFRRQRADREQLTRYFVGTEGQSELALARWIELLCTEAGHKILFYIPRTGPRGGSTLSVVQDTLKTRKRSSRGPFSRTLVFFDEDRRAFDGPAAEALAQRERVLLVWQQPNVEGLLLRLYPGQERRQPPANRTLRELQRLWPNYEKNGIAASDLRERFVLIDLQRAARFDMSLLMLLRELGLENA